MEEAKLSNSFRQSRTTDQVLFESRQSHDLDSDQQYESQV